MLFVSRVKTGVQSAHVRKENMSFEGCGFTN